MSGRLAFMIDAGTGRNVCKAADRRHPVLCAAPRNGLGIGHRVDIDAGWVITAAVFDIFDGAVGVRLAGDIGHSRRRRRFSLAAGRKN